MKVSINWLKELVGLKVSIKELITLLPMRTIGLKDVTEDSIELDMKGYNRADLLSMRGVAREVAAITDSSVNFSDTDSKDFIWQGKNLPQTPVEIANPSLASIQCVAKIENLKVGPSSKEVAKRLEESGMRSIDNITDITNLIMLEFGQPLHSFDASGVKDETIIVRAAKAGEEITTIDHKKRKLEVSDIVLADTKVPLDVAGVMGGSDTEIKPSTTTILLSASLFNPVNVRRTSQRLALYSEASRRFQHGLTATNLYQALDAAIRMYESLGGKLTAINIVGNFKDPVRKVKLTQAKLNSLIGIKIKPAEVEKYLTSLGFHPKGVSINSWEVTVPYWRLDINIEEDLIEEVVRLYGYERIPPQELRGKQPAAIDQSLPNLIYDLKKALADAGLTEVQTYSFYSTNVLENFGWDQKNLVKVANPISSETEYLREDIWPNLVEVAAENMKQGYKDIGIFEIGKVYGPGEKTPSESYRVSLSLMNGSDNPTAELYQIFRGVNLVHLQGVQLGEGKRRDYEEKYFHPTRFAFLMKNGQTIGGIAEVHPRFTDKFGINRRVAVLEFKLEP